MFPQDLTLAAAYHPVAVYMGSAQARVQRHNIVLTDPSPLHFSASTPGILQQHAPDFLLLARLGWEGFLTRKHCIDADIPSGGHRWAAHKAFIKADTVITFDTHEGDVLLPWDTDSGNITIPDSCAFGVHVVNTFKHRSEGSGVALKVEGKSFDMHAYICHLLASQSLDSESERRPISRGSSHVLC